MPVRRRPRDARRAARGHRAQLALLHPGHRAGAALRLSGARAVRPGERAALQPEQAPHRPLREGDRGADRMGPGQRPAVRARPRRRRRFRARRRGRRRCHPEVRRGRPRLRLGRRRGAANGVERHRDLRGAREGVHPAAPRDPRRPARHIRRTCLRAGTRVLPRARRHGGRAAADPPHRRRGVPPRSRALQLLGLLLDRLPRAARTVRRDGQERRAGTRVQRDGEGPARGRDRGDPRRRLQPHGRGKPPRADALLPRPRQPQLLPAHAGRAALLHGFHGDRQLAQPHASLGAAA